jgi:hypothetical protein
MAESRQSKTLLGALRDFQGEAPKLQKDKINPAFKSKYLSLSALMEQVLPALNAHGLVWVTLPGADERGEPALAYRLIHVESGEVIDGAMPLLVAKRDPQGVGSALTYARRQALMAVLGLVADEDDDGNTASGNTNGGGAASNGTGAPKASRMPAAAKNPLLAELDQFDKPALILSAAGVPYLSGEWTVDDGPKIRAAIDAELAKAKVTA